MMFGTAPRQVRPVAGTPAIDRLTVADLGMLWPDAFGWPQDMSVIAVLDGAPLLDGAGRVRVERVRDAITRRLHLVPRLRQVVHYPRPGLGRPLWVDAPSFDVTEHVRVHPLPAAADEEQLLRACEQLHQRRLNPSRPLWALWLLPGLPGDRVGMFMKLHHVVADGMAGLALFGALLDLDPTATAPAAPPRTPRTVPSARELALDNLRRQAAAICAVAGRLRHPIRTARRMHAGWPALRELFLARPAPHTSLNRPVGPDRRIGVCRGRLDTAKDVARADGAKVNDVVLAAIATGLRDLLQERGETVDGLLLRAVVPVSMHQGPPGYARGNRAGGMMVDLPIGEPDPRRRLHLIAAATRHGKNAAPRLASTGIMNSATARKAMLRMMRRQRMANIYVANVPGPPMPLYLAGARLLELFPVVPLIGNITLGVGVLSYCGQLNITAVTDQHTAGGLPVLLAGLQRALCPEPVST